jgi:hypothetical protein
MSDENKVLNKQDTKRLAEKRGTGSGKDYVPFIKVGEFSSSGESIRVKSRVAKRIHHFHSGIEFSAFMIFEWFHNTLDIREQFPIPLTDSLLIAKELGIKHPQNKGELSIVSTDLVIDFISGKGLAIAAKPAEELKKIRVIEKLQIEKTFWEAKGISWKVFTEKDISNDVKENITWLRPIMDLDLKQNANVEVDDLFNFEKRIRNYNNTKLTKLCGRLDDEYGLEPGHHITIMRYGISNRIFEISLKKTYYSLTCDDLTLSKAFERGIKNVS